MDVSDLKFTVPVIRARELTERECFGCVFDYEENEVACKYMQEVHGRCQDLCCVYILDTPESIANHARRLMLGEVPE